MRRHLAAVLHVIGTNCLRLSIRIHDPYLETMQRIAGEIELRRQLQREVAGEYNVHLRSIK